MFFCCLPLVCEVLCNYRESFLCKSNTRDKKIANYILYHITVGVGMVDGDR